MYKVVQRVCLSVQATDRFVQALFSLKQLLRLCIPTSMCKRNVKCKQVLAYTCPISAFLIPFSKFLHLHLFLFLLHCSGAAQLYQQYSEAAQNFEILRQSRSDALSVCENTASSPASSPLPVRRPLPPLPPVPHPHSLSHTGSLPTAKLLPLPELPKTEGRPSSPRSSISLSQLTTLWRDLPTVSNNPELQKLTEDQRRLQEVGFH